MTQPTGVDNLGSTKIPFAQGLCYWSCKNWESSRETEIGSACNRHQSTLNWNEKGLHNDCSATNGLCMSIAVFLFSTACLTVVVYIFGLNYNNKTWKSCLWPSSDEYVHIRSISHRCFLDQARQTERKKRAYKPHPKHLHFIHRFLMTHWVLPEPAQARSWDSSLLFFVQVCCAWCQVHSLLGQTFCAATPQNI